MINTILLLFYEFFKIGIFAVGGGYATIPFLIHLTEIYPWFSFEELTNMIAVSNLTPGPVGINMATYSGYKTTGLLGGFVSTFGIILGPFLITILTIYFINKFRESKIIKTIFQMLRPASLALLTFVMIQLINENIIQNTDIKAILILIILFLTYPFLKKQPSFVIIFGAALGVIFNIF